MEQNMDNKKNRGELEDWMKLAEEDNKKKLASNYGDLLKKFNIDLDDDDYDEDLTSEDIM
jgi:hypothetical protein